MKVVQESLQADASAWSAVVEVQGVAYVAHFVANRLTVRLAPYKYPPRRPRWHMKVVQDWAEEKVAALSPEWLAMHRSLYAT
jgi:hypothetical protein